MPDSQTEAKVRVTVSGKVVELPAGSPAVLAFKEAGVKGDFLAAKADGKVIDLKRPLKKDCTLEPVVTGTKDGLDVMRHTSAHVMAQAVARLYGAQNVEFAIGPVIDDGFYYDFDIDHKFVPEDFPKIEAEMKKIVAENLTLERREVAGKAEALAVLEGQRARFKRELIQDLPDTETISFYTQGEFTDLCRGPHLTATGKIKAFKIMSVAGAYWRGDEKRDMLQRLYATAFFSEKELEEFVHNLEEAKKRDHKKLGRELDLFSFHQEAPGFPFWHPKGMVIYDTIVDYWKKKHTAASYHQIKTPIILNESLWHQSGHWDNYRENMYFTEIDEQVYAVKPMNCPGGTLVYRSDLRSYREFPLRMAELGLVHRHEKSGVLNGLFRVRAFTQDDAHIYCTPEMLKEEIVAVMDLIFEIYRDFGFSDVNVNLSTRPEKSIGSDAMWANAEGSLTGALEHRAVKYAVDPGAGAFYGPKIDFQIRDSLKRYWQCGTIQVDFSMPERFEMEYVAADGARKRPVMIHRALLGSIERFLGVLIEHYGGAFPTWLAPEQVRVVPVSEDKQAAYSKRVLERLLQAGLRASVDLSSSRMGAKIRDAQMQKIPYMLVVGAREEETESVAVRRRDEMDLGAMGAGAFVERVLDEVRTRSLTLTLTKQ
ncbi:MAG: threonine--tRNA ligase [Planctomycetes bacterium]|nr:threonine--tRNA ligase [Planctomycetota bacterium]MBI3847665.1 threonine--tRNA ligase [Planctomycetota bacterium]